MATDFSKRLERIEALKLAPRIRVQPFPDPDNMTTVEDEGDTSTELVIVTGVPVVDPDAPRSVFPRQYTETIDMDTVVPSSHEPDPRPAPLQETEQQVPEESEPERVHHSLAPQVRVQPATGSFIVRTGVDGAETVPLLTWVRR